MTTSQPAPLPSKNRLLDALAPQERSRLAGEVEEVQLEFKQRLCEAGGRIDSVYFPLTAVVSMLNDADGSGGVEIATIGNEGLVGVSLLWDAITLNPSRVSPGSGARRRPTNGCRSLCPRLLPGQRRHS